MKTRETLFDKLCDLTVEVEGIADILFVCSCLYGERDDSAPVSNERMEGVLLGLSCYAKRLSDAISDLDTRGQTNGP